MRIPSKRIVKKIKNNHVKINPLKKSSLKVATGLATAGEASLSNPSINKASTDLAAQLVTQAVTTAMQKANITSASSVLLFLTSEFATDPQSAIKAAAKTASCTQIIGCSATGIFTDEDWVLDCPAAAAMVFGGDVSLENVREPSDNQLLLTLTAPNAINTTWLNNKGIRFGGVSGDAIGHGPFSVWENGKGTVQGLCEITFKHTRGVVAATHGLRFLSEPKRITLCNKYDIQTLDDESALANLQRAYTQHHSQIDNNYAVIPYHQLIAVYADDINLIHQGNYNQATIIGGDETDNTVTLAKCLNENQWLCWAIRNVEAAATDFKKIALDLGKSLAKTAPDFGLLFSCLGRGPYLYGSLDKDLLQLRELYPNMPFIGFYGNGEIAPINGKNELLQYSAVLGLFKAD